jgi:hypothetical protein
MQPDPRGGRLVALAGEADGDVTKTPQPWQGSHLGNRFYGEALQRVDAAQPRFNLVMGELLDRLAEALGQPPLLVGPRLLVMPIGRGPGWADSCQTKAAPPRPATSGLTVSLPFKGHGHTNSKRR